MLFRNGFFRHDTDISPADGTSFLVIYFFNNAAGVTGTTGTSQLFSRFRVTNGTGALFFELPVFQEKHFYGKT